MVRLSKREQRVSGQPSQSRAHCDGLDRRSFQGHCSEKPKQILFKPEMVRSILDGRKNVTRRVVKGSESFTEFIRSEVDPAVIAVTKKGLEYPKQLHGLYAAFEQDGAPEFLLVKAPFRPGDILYVRERWAEMPYGYVYYADGEEPEGWDADDCWHPSIHMPKEAVRLFLQVTGVRVERLQDINGYGVLAEGVDNGQSNPTMGRRWENMQRMAFSSVWDSTIKKADLPRYGWAANPWVWVIEFERISKEETQRSDKGL